MPRADDLTKFSRYVELAMPFVDTVTECYPPELRRLEEQAGRKLRKQRRAELREAKCHIPAFFRKLKQLTEDQVQTLYAEFLEQEMKTIESLPNFKTDPELQHLHANHKYFLRSTRAILGYRANPLRPKPIPRYRPAPI